MPDSSEPRRAAPPLIGEEWREFTRAPLYMLFALGLLLIALVYQVRSAATLRVDVGTQTDQPYLVDFHAHEANKQITYRWSGDRNAMVVPGPGRNQSFDLAMNIIGYRPAGQPAAVLTVTVGNNVVATFMPAPVMTAYTVTIPASLNTADDLSINFLVNPFSTAGDPRKLGLIFDTLTLTPASDPTTPSGLVLPPTSHTAWLLLSLLLLYLSLRHLRVSRRSAMAVSTALMLVAAALLLLDRYDLTLFTAPLLTVMLCVYGLALLLPPVVAWTLMRLGAKPSAMALQALMLIYLAAFAIKAGGMMHPQFQILDQGLRAHQVQELIADPAAFWAKYQQISTADTSGAASSSGLTLLGQWHIQVPIPYSPIAYYLFVPFGLLWHSSNADTVKLIIASETMLAALVGTLAFALYALAKRGLGNGRAGVIAAAIALFAPVSYLHFSDGDWTYIWGGWLAVVYIMAAVCLADKAGKPLPFAILSLLAGLTLASHTAIALFAAAFVPLAAIIVLLMRRGGYGFPLWPLLASFVVGVALSLIYYGAYVVPLLTVTVPAIVGQLGNGVGQDQQFLGRPLLSGFWPQIWAHFTAWPLALAVAGLALLIKRRRDDNIPTEAGIRRLCLAIIITWAVVFALFSLADLKVNLLQRHMLFALPLLGLLASYALVRLMQWGTHSGQPLANTVASGQTYHQVLLEVIKREWFGWLVTLGLVAFLFLVGWEVWLNRVMNYVLPPGSG